MLVIGEFGPGTGRKTGIGAGYGTCGELVQGFTGDGQPFHVTCPIAKSATVTLTLTPAKQFSIENLPPALAKVGLAIKETASYLDLEPCSVRIAHWSELEVGKGMGSSTADIVAASRALANAVDRTLNATELASIATAIESSDGSMYPGLVAFNQKTGATLARYKWWPQFLIAMVTPRDILNTEAVNFGTKRDFGADFDTILATLAEASANKTSAPFAECATESARLNQRYVPNPHFAALDNKIADFGADGINVGHTGTLTGLLFEASRSDAALLSAAATVELKAMFPDAHVETIMTRDAGIPGLI